MIQAARYLWPLSGEFHACRDFSQSLSLSEKIKTIAVTALAALASCFLLGLAGVATFRLMVLWYKSPIDETARTIIEEKKSLKPPVDIEGYKQFEKMTAQELTQHTERLQGPDLVHFWRLENQAASNYKEKSEIENMRRRLKIELSTLTSAQLETSLPLSFFWNLITNPYCIETAASALSPACFGAMGAWLQEQKSTAHAGDLLEFETYFKTLIGKIPVEDTFLLEKKLEALCPHISVEQEQIVKGKIQAASLEKRQMLRRLSDASLKRPVHPSRPDDSALLSPLQRLKLSNSQTRRKSWAAFEKQEAPPPLPAEPSIYQRKATDEECRNYVLQWKGGAGALHQDAFFWVLEHVEDAGETGTALVKHLTLLSSDLEEYTRLEKMTEPQLKGYVKLLEGESLLKLWELENYAAGRYTGKSELMRLHRRLAIELPQLQDSQLKSSLPLNVFWRLLDSQDYQDIAAKALTPDHYGTMAEWLNTLMEAPDDADEILALKNPHPKIYLKELTDIFKALINRIPSDTEEEKITLSQKLLAIGAFASKDMQDVIKMKLPQLRRSDRKMFKGFLT